MTMPSPPPDTRAAGQSGHIGDHNAISDAITAIETAVSTLQNQMTALQGGGPGITQLPWNALGGWVGSTMDPEQVNGSYGFGRGNTYAAAIVAETTAPFSKVVIYKGSGSHLQAGTGAQMAITDASGNWLAHVTNFDTVMTNAALVNCFCDLTLNTSVTPAAGQVLYAVFLFPTTVTSTGWLGVGNSGNRSFVAGESAVAYVSWASNNHSTDATISSPFPIPASLVSGAEFVPFLALK